MPKATITNKSIKVTTSKKVINLDISSKKKIKVTNG